MTLNDLRRPPATGPGDPAEFDIAAALATAAACLADAVDDNRPGWLATAVDVGDLLAELVTARADAGARLGRAVLNGIFASDAAPLDTDVYDAALYIAAADLSATAADLAQALAEGRPRPGHLTRARHLLDTIADALGEPVETDPDTAAGALFDAEPYRRYPR